MFKRSARVPDKVCGKGELRNTGFRERIPEDGNPLYLLPKDRFPDSGKIIGIGIMESIGAPKPIGLNKKYN